MTALLLGALGLTLSLLVPRPLARARWTARVPAAAVALWQAITLAAVLSAVGVVLAAPEELVRATGRGAEAALIGALAVAAVIVVRLLWCLGGVMYRSRARRERHRTLVDLLDRAERRAGLTDEVRVLDGPLPFAYCLPGRSPRVVVSDGALQVLTAEQVAAVIAHEQAHLRRRHDLVTESFTAFHRAVPRPLRSRRPLDAVHLLLEMLADDAARRAHGDAALRDALTTMGDATTTPETDGGRDEQAERRRRLERLRPGAPGPDRRLAAAVLAAAAGVLVLPTVFLVVPWLDTALGNWPL
ncbi:M56 family metallopeptidase [Spirilliplanes yamanashiensis]|uniref:Peptidase M48 domain-containing protein n=1 Tax=Spirilliplanes yamanashiensis TaxID=42233 RepID=A0A8J3YB42_9ACTN|nr:M56 family metallopeptidase [Spirilliplanes yamanashiensis]MDP9818991.1 Zn-dependent protease with chaperone function [Spirilliplanes yamanashiensis]GIJ05446.1 hypothetical protein Sya03_47980 [Spirilliplanes yamanashiensis]